MPRLRYLNSARADLLHILEHIARQSESVEVASAFVDRLREKCRDLADLPGTMGRPRPELRSDLRSYPYGNYVIFFRYHAERFEVVNILARHRDIDGYYHNDPPD